MAFDKCVSKCNPLKSFRWELGCAFCNLLMPQSSGKPSFLAYNVSYSLVVTPNGRA